MPPRGYCRACECLVEIRRVPRPHPTTQRPCDWVPADHVDPRTGERCAGVRLPL